MRRRRPRWELLASGSCGQAAVEWVGLTFIASLLVTGSVAAAGGFHGTGLARELAERLVCAVRLQIPCRHDPELLDAYDAEVAGLLREHAPLISYERGMRSLPVDFRSCRSPECANGSTSGRATGSLLGSPVTAFTHVVDCRRPGSPRPDSADCSGRAAGNLYLHYWLFYPDSASLRGAPIVGDEGYHLDDWESFQVKVSPNGRVLARASSHNGYNGLPSIGDWASDTAGRIPGAESLRRFSERIGIREENGWTPVIHSRSLLLVAGGSHAGRAGGRHTRFRWTPPAALLLKPIESVARDGSRFAVTPPWRKRVYLQPEYSRTD